MICVLMSGCMLKTGLVPDDLWTRQKIGSGDFHRESWGKVTYEVSNHRC